MAGILRTGRAAALEQAGHHTLPRRSRTSTDLALLAVLCPPLFAGCVGGPNVRGVVDGGIGGGRHGFGMSAGGFAYQPERLRGFGTLSFAGPVAGREPEYDEGTAASFGDPRIGEDSDAIGVAGGWTYAFELGGAGQLLGLFAGPALALESTWAEYDDPTGILEQGEGSYWERTDSDGVLGATLGLHWVRSDLALGLSYDSAVGLFALRIGWAPPR